METQLNYPALIDGEPGNYGVVFPDIDGIGAMGSTVEEALRNARAVLIDYALEMERDGLSLSTPSPLNSVAVPPGNQLATVPLHYAPTIT